MTHCFARNAKRFDERVSRKYGGPQLKYACTQFWGLLQLAGGIDDVLSPGGGVRDVLEIYGTFPHVVADTHADFVQPVVDVAQWTEAAGLTGLLVFTDNSIMDPWLAAQFVIERTATLVPLVAVQPVYMHPYTAARMVSTLSSLYDRRVDLNLVAGGYRPHLRALGDSLEHDERYERLVEYGEIMLGLLGMRGDEVALTHQGRHCAVLNARLAPPLPRRLKPRVFVAGSSSAAADTARKLGAVRLAYPHPPDDYAQPTMLDGMGTRVGIIARETSAAAWTVAERQYPRDPHREAVSDWAAKPFDAQWHNRIWADATRRGDTRDTYWLYPFRTGYDYCPYLVGSYAEVGELLSRYLRMGITTLILSRPWGPDDLRHAMVAIRHAEALSLTNVVS